MRGFLNLGDVILLISLIIREKSLFFLFFTLIINTLALISIISKKSGFSYFFFLTSLEIRVIRFLKGFK